MPKDHEQLFDIKHYLSILQSRRYVALSVGLIVLSLFTWGSFFIPKTYEASSSVSIERGSTLKPLMQGVGVAGNMEDRLKNLKSEMTSKSITEKVIKKLGMNKNAKDPAQKEALIERVRRNLDVRVTGGPNLINISYEGDDPETVTKVVNTFTSVYIDEYVRSKRSDVTEAYDFIRNQLLEYKNKLDESDGKIREFKEKNPNLVPQSETTLLTRLEGQQSARVEAEIRVKELLRRKENLQKQLGGEKELTVAFVTREGSPQARLSYLNSQLMLLMAKYTEHYPEVIKIKSEIEELKKQIAQAKISRMESSGSETAAMNPIYQQLKEDLSKTDAEIEALRGRTTELSKHEQEIQRIFRRMPREQEEWTKLQRDRNVYQQIYDQLLQKLENARVSREIETEDKGETFRIVDPAKVPLYPIKPNRVKMILFGIFFGIALGVGIVFGLDYFDHSFKDEDSIEDILKLPVLAAIPKIVTEADELLAKKLELKVYVASGAYFFIICLVLIGELLSRYMGIKIINF